MSEHTVQEHNATTGEITIRPMTDQELQVFESDKIEALADKTKAEQAQMSKEAAQAKLADLGLTTDDLKALGL